MIDGISKNKDQEYVDLLKQQIEILDDEMDFLHGKTLEEQIIDKKQDEKTFEILNMKREILVEVLGEEEMLGDEEYDNLNKNEIEKK
mgnify:CR=1 FL=1